MKESKPLILTMILILMLFFFSSVFYKTLILIILTFAWRVKIREWKPKAYIFTLIVLCLVLFTSMPRYRYNNNDRVRLIYQDEKGNPTYPPMSHYILNILFPEEELCNLGIIGSSIMPNKLPMNGWLLQDFNRDLKKGRIINFYKAYNRLDFSGIFTMSGIVPQAINMYGGEYGLVKTRSVYVIRPQHYDKDKSYPVVFFMHGFLGNWKLYTGILKDLKDCIVVCAGTNDWVGKFTSDDVRFHLNTQIPFLEQLGYKVDKDNLHIIGLSNGGSACDVAYNSFSRQFKSITYISSEVHQSYKIHSKVMLIGGGNDPASQAMTSSHKKLKANGVNVEMFWEEDQGHFIFVNKQREIIDFLNSHYNFE